MRRSPPRLVARTLTVTFGTVAAILSIVFVAMTIDVRNRVRASELDKLRASETVFSALEAKRRQDAVAAMATLAENPTLKAALDTYFTERGFSGSSDEQLRATVTGETTKLVANLDADVLAVLDTDHRIFASAGRLADEWPAELILDIPERFEPTFRDVTVLPTGAFAISAASLTFGDRMIGWLVAGTSLNATYAQELSDLSGAGVVIAVDDQIIARTVPERVARDLVDSGDASGTRTLGDEEYAVRQLPDLAPARVFTLSSIDDAARAPTREALSTLGIIALGGFLFAALASFWLARLIAHPINRLSRNIATMTAARDFGQTLPATGTSREVDTLTDTFNDLLGGLEAAEAETRAAYLGAIRALAAALDARDPYTAGHSERVSTLSVMMSRTMGIGGEELEIIRLGALLHDIGKIGVADEILRKAESLTEIEFEQLKRHPTLGARILRQVPFLAPHLPIVELHHERPDGRGYPYGLRGNEIPLAARIVHVADAFDAITSARAYRAARSMGEAFAELQRYAGTQFDEACVEALQATLPFSHDVAEPVLAQFLSRQTV